MVDTATIRTTVGVIGNVISFCLFLSPVPTFVQIVKAKSTQEYVADPYVATILNCAMWVFYGLPIVHPNSILVITINGIGLLIEFTYLAIFLIYATAAKRKRIMLYLLIEAVFFAIIVFVTLTFLHGTKNRSMLVGIVCIVFNILMYTAPLTIMKKVITTKSVKYMPFFLSLANFCNGCVWLVYAFLPLDPYIAVPNGLGVFSGIIQLGLYAAFYRTTNWDEDDEKPSEVQMTAA